MYLCLYFDISDALRILIEKIFLLSWLVPVFNDLTNSERVVCSN